MTTEEIKESVNFILNKNLFNIKLYKQVVNELFKDSSKLNEKMAILLVITSYLNFKWIPDKTLYKLLKILYNKQFISFDFKEVISQLFQNYYFYYYSLNQLNLHKFLLCCRMIKMGLVYNINDIDCVALSIRNLLHIHSFLLIKIKNPYYKKIFPIFVKTLMHQLILKIHLDKKIYDIEKNDWTQAIVERFYLFFPEYVKEFESKLLLCEL